MDPVPPPSDGDVNRGPQLLALFWVLTILAFLIVGLRFYVRIKIRAVGLDDWTMLFTVALFAVMTGGVTKLAIIGGARHMYFLSPQQQFEAIKWSWIVQPPCIFLFATGKTAVALLILRILGPNARYRKWILYFFSATSLALGAVACIITFVQCNPPRALWTPGIPSKCWDPLVQERYNYFYTAWNMLFDVVLSVLPLTMFWKMMIPKNRKIFLCCLLSVGLIDIIVSGVKIKYLVELTKRTVDFTWTLYNVQAWSAADGFIVIVCGSIPPLQPLWDRFISHKLDSSYGRTPIKNGWQNHPSKSDGNTKVSSFQSRTLISSSQNDSPAESKSEFDKNIHATTVIDQLSEQEMV